VLALAVLAQADLMVSGDAGLIVLGANTGIPIDAPGQALSLVGIGRT